MGVMWYCIMGFLWCSAVEVENNSGGSMVDEGVMVYWLPDVCWTHRDTCWPIEEMLAEI